MLQIGIIEAGNWGRMVLRSRSLRRRCAVVTVLTDRAPADEVLKRLPESTRVVPYVDPSSYDFLLEPDLDAVLMAGWLRRVPARVIDNMAGVFANIHPSLLPRFRGPQPMVQQLLHEVDEAGVTLHQVEEDWDTGVVYEQVAFPVRPADTASTVFVKAARAAEQAISQFVEALENDRLAGQAQDHDAATYFRRIDPRDYGVQKADTCADVSRRARAFEREIPLLYPYDGQWYEAIEFDITVTEKTGEYAHSIALEDGFLGVREGAPWEQSQR